MLSFVVLNKTKKSLPCLKIKIYYKKGAIIVVSILGLVILCPNIEITQIILKKKRKKKKKWYRLYYVLSNVNIVNSSSFPEDTSMAESSPAVSQMSIVSNCKQCHLFGVCICTIPNYFFGPFMKTTV